MSEDKSSKWGWIYYGSTLLAGTISSIATKSMSKKTAPLPGHDPPFQDYFQHPYMLTFCMFLGEFLCLPIFYINRACCKSKADDSEKKRINPFLCAIPALCDTVGSAFIYNAYNIAAISIIQMLSGVRIILTAILSVIFLKAKLYVHHIVGLILIFSGLLLVGFAVYLDESASSSFLGVIFVVLGYTTAPIQFVIEEFMFRKYTLHPLEIIGYESSAGCVYSIIILIVFQQITCTRVRQEGEYNTYPQTAHCPYGRLEESTVGLYQVRNSLTMLMLMIIVIITLCIFNFTSQGVTKHLSGTARSTVSVIQTVII